MTKISPKICNLALLTFIIALLLPATNAQAEALIELTDIKVNESNTGAFIEIDTSGEVKFLFYKLDNPPRLVIDFIGTNVVTQEPQKIIFDRGKVKEIQNIFYDIAEEDGSYRLDSLVLKFRPNVEVRVKSVASGIMLEVKDAALLAEAEKDEYKLIRAYALAGKIAKQKQNAHIRENKLAWLTSRKIARRQEQLASVQTTATLISNAAYPYSFYETYIKRPLYAQARMEPSSASQPDRLAQRQLRQLVIADTYQPPDEFLDAPIKRSGLLAAASIFVIGAGVLTAAALSRRKRPGKKAQHQAASEQKQDRPLEDLLEEEFNNNFEEKKQRLAPKDDSDKCIEKRKYARFNIPDEESLCIYLDLETRNLQVIHVRAINISLGGVAAELGSDLEVPDVLNIGIRMPDDNQLNEVLARRVWSKDESTNSRQYGFSFIMLTEEEEKRIRTFLKQHF